MLLSPLPVGAYGADAETVSDYGAETSKAASAEAVRAPDADESTEEVVIEPAGADSTAQAADEPEEDDSTAQAADTPMAEVSNESAETDFETERAILLDIPFNSGDCGDDLSWAFYEDGALVLEGSGDMYDYYYYNAPWYDYNEKIVEVILPDGLTSIGQYAFYECSELKTVTIPDSVTEIGHEAFYGCSSLEALTVPAATETFGNNAFSGCDSLTLTVFRGSQGRTYAAENGYRHIISGDENGAAILWGGSCGESLFWSLYEDGALVLEGSGDMYDYYYYNVPWYDYNEQIVEVILPDGLTSIGQYAFYECSELKSVSIPDSVTKIGHEAFYGCSSLEALAIPSGASSIDRDAFSGCPNLLLTVFPDSEGRAYAIKNSLRHVLAADGDSPEPVEVLHSGSCGTSLSWLLQADGALVLEGSGEMKNYSSGGAPWYAYRESITAIALPDDLVSIGNCAFYQCEAVESVVIPESVTKIGSGAFQSCAALTSLNLPQSAASVESNAFNDCAALTLSVLRGSYGRRYAIKNGLPYATQEEARSVTAQGSCGDTLCWMLFEDGTLELEGYGSMYGKSAAKDTPWYANKDEVKSLSIPEDVTSIGARAFSECGNLSAVTFPESLKSIGDYAFSKCASLKALAIPEGVSSVSSSAFSDCPDLTLTVIRGSDGRAFAVKNHLRHVVSDAPQTVIADSGVCGDNLWWLFYESGTLAFEGSGNMSNYSQTDAHATAPWYSHCAEITAVNIPEGVTRIGSYAFYGDSQYLSDYRFVNLTSVALPASVTAVGDRAFYQCVGLTSAVLSDNTATIGDYAFYGCENLSALDVPALTKSIGSNAFSACPKLTLKVYAGSYAQEYATKNGVRHVAGEGSAVIHSGSCGEKLMWALHEDGVLTFAGSGNMWDYGKKGSDSPWTTAPWFDYRDQITSVAIPEGVTKLGAYAFYGGMDYAKDYRFTKLSGVTFPASLTTLGDHAFEGCAGLVSLSLPDELSAIGAYAFANCSALENLTTPKNALQDTEETPVPKNPLPENLGKIGESAFYSCSSLTELTIPKGANSIGKNAFAACDNLTVTVYPGSYAAEEYVLQNNIKHVVWGASGPNVTASGVCGDSLKWLLYEDGTLTFQGAGAMREYSEQSNESPNTTAPWYFHKDLIVSVVVPDGVTNVGAYAFYGGKYYENDCRFANLKSVKIADSVTTVGKRAFCNCVSLAEIGFSSKLNAIGERAFSGCESLTEVALPQGLKSIGANAFSDCAGLTLRLSQESYAREYAVKNGLRHATLENPDKIAVASGSCGNSLYWILYEGGELAFEGSGKMWDYSADSHHTTAPWYPYFGQVASVTIPDGVTKIGAYAFYGLKYFEEDYRFSKLSAVTIPNSVTEIGSCAFRNCASLTELTVSPYVTSIGTQAFADCSNLTLTVYKDQDGESSVGRTYALKNGLRHTLYGEGRAVTACGECGYSLYWMLYSDGKLEFEGSGAMRDYSGNRYKTDAPWSLYRNEIIAVTIPDGVTKIGAYAFYGALYYAKDYRFSNLTSVRFPDSLKEIGSYAFAGCAGLTAPNVPDNVSSIGSYAFSGCAGLTSLHIPDNLKTIPSHLFDGCSALSKVDIPEGVTSVSEKAFYGCNTLASLLIPQSVTSFGKDAFANCRNLTLKVYKDSRARDYAAENKLRYRVVETDELVEGENDVAPIAPIAPAEPFDVSRDAYAFANTAAAFQYSGEKYPIPYESFKLIFGDSVAGKSKYKQTSMGKWGGNCNGFSSTAALMYYAAAGMTPSSFGKADVSSLSIGDKNSSDNITVKTFIEAMQVAQYTDTFAKDYQGNKRVKGQSLNDLISAVETSVSQGECVIIAVGKQGVGAHALLAYGVEKVSASEYAMYLYDCNFPGEVRTAKFAGTGGAFTRWTYEMCEPYGEWGTEGDAGSRCFISFIPFETIRYIWENRGGMYQSKEMLSVNAANLSIQDSSGKEVASLKDGQLVTDSPDIFEVPELSMTWSDNNSIYLPKDLYTIVTDDNLELKATMTDRNLQAEVTTSSNSVTFAVDDASRENTVFIDGMTEADTYSVNLSSSFLDAQYETLSVSGTGSAGMQGDTISISGAKDSLALSSNITYNSISINGKQAGEVRQYAINAVAGEGGAISPSGDVLVTAGEAQSFEFVPKPGYKVSHVEVDGVDKGALPSYLFPSVNVEGHKIAVYFEKAYEIGEASFDASSKTATAASLMSLTASTLTGMAFDRSGKFIASASSPVEANAPTASVTFGADLPDSCVIKLVLMDGDNRPLCNPFTV